MGKTHRLFAAFFTVLVVLTSVNSVAFAFVPIQGDITNDGVVNITDLRTVAGYFDVKQGDSLWSTASAYDLNGNGVIDIYDLVLIGANFS